MDEKVRKLIDHIKGAVVSEFISRIGEKPKTITWELISEPTYEKEHVFSIEGCAWSNLCLRPLGLVEGALPVRSIHFSIVRLPDGDYSVMLGRVTKKLTEIRKEIITDVVDIVQWRME